ncbi:MAG TPA: amino acid adenylation domain-containing protein [Chloroflexota bacterium]|jgi:amino acid adenylation domain-containing protein
MSELPALEALYPLSPTQQGILLETRRSASGVYIGQMTCLLRGDLDVGAFRRAWELVIARHAALRTGYLFEGLESPLQCVWPRAEVPCRITDLRQMPPEQSAAYVAEFEADDRVRAFDLNTPPLMRLHLFRLEDELTRLVWTRHHLMLDGWSANLALGEVQDLYADLRRGAEPALPAAPSYQRFVEWLSSHDWSPARAFWQRDLVEFEEPTHLARTQVSRVSSATATPVEQTLKLEPDVSETIRAFARSIDVTPATVFTAAWALLLSRHTSRDDVVFGMTLAGRPAELQGADSIVGMFVNTVPLRVRMCPGQRLVGWLQQLYRHMEDVREHQHLPHVEVRACSNVAEQQVLFDHILVVEAYPNSGNGVASDTGFTVEDYRFVDQTTFPLNVGVVVDETITLVAVYDPEVHSEWFARNLLESFSAAVASIATSHPGAHLWQVDSMAEQQRLQALERFNDTDCEWSPESDLVAGLNACAARYPEVEAVRAGSRSLTYAELASESDAVAAELRQRLDTHEPIVALCAERSAGLVVSILAILKMGGAYLPLDPEDPPGRLRSLLAAANADLVLADPPLVDKLAQSGIAIVMLPEDSRVAVPGGSFTPRMVPPRHAAYVIYTSGSTGMPKPVLNHRQGLLNRLLWMQSAYPLHPGDRVLQKTAYTFDVSVWEFLWPLMCGATLVLAEPGGHRDPAYVRDLIVSERISVVHFVPSMLKQFLDQPGIEGCTSLRHVISSGEALPGYLRDRFFERVGAELHNLYGPTEAAIDVTFHDCRRASDAGSSVPIGRPIANTQLYVLDQHLLPVPPGATGELFIGGCGLARGYYGQPGLTAERFVPDPFSAAPGARLYRTGDLCRLLESGEIEYAGRADFQVKIRGIRIEPGEIESAIRRQAGVLDCAVLVHTHPDTEEGQLIAHVVPTDSALVAAGAEDRFLADLRTGLTETLPGHLLPTRFVVHQSLPLTPSGKLDRAALRDSVRDALPGVSRRTEQPRNELEVTLAEIWREVLGLPVVGIQESFFELGGHSLSLIQVSNRIQTRLGVAIPLRDLFNAQSIEQMAEAIVDRELAQVDPAELAPLLAEVQALSPEEVLELLAEDEAASTSA